MCVAIGQKAGAITLTSDELDNGWDSNPDGGGIAYIDGDGNLIQAHFMKKSQLKKAYFKAHAKYGESSPFIVHMRIATHGSVQLATCHPFRVKTSVGQTSLAHNGIIQDVDEHTSVDVSDTMAFIEQVLDHLPDNWMDNEYLVDMVSDFIGWSKLVILTTSSEAKQELYIINETAGSWVKDTWFSNSSCKTAPYKWSGHGYGNDYGADYSKWWPKGTNVYIEDDDLMYDAVTLRSLNTGSELKAMVDDCVDKDVWCIICTGIKECYCSHLCAECYEQYHECECKGSFVSLESVYLQDAFKDAKVEGINAEMLSKHAKDKEIATLDAQGNWVWNKV